MGGLEKKKVSGGIPGPREVGNGRGGAGGRVFPRPGLLVGPETTGASATGQLGEGSADGRGREYLCPVKSGKEPWGGLVRELVTKHSFGRKAGPAEGQLFTE